MAKQLVQALKLSLELESGENAALVVGASLLMGILGRFRHAAAVYAGSADAGQLWRPAGGTHTGQPAWIRRTYALSRGRCCGIAGIRPQRSVGRCSIVGPTGGYLISYPFVAFVAGWIAERGQKSFARYALASVAGEILLFVSGVSWIMVLLHAPLAQAANFGLYPFIFAEIIKVLAAAELGRRAKSSSRFANLLA